ncbi:MAG: hypothetical protein LBM39_03230 [Candidatus Methanoplasma sp.]|jgi:hypothetical protein|nr:hypothetical protein [Candidatus Methanoplasma sp.]
MDVHVSGWRALNVKQKITKHPLAFILLIGLIIRFILIPLFTFSFDMTFWVATSQGLEGGRDIYETSYFWYTPLWGYVIGLQTWIGNAVGLADYGHLFPELVVNYSQTTIPNMTITTIGANILYKAPLVLIDVATTFILFHTVMHLTSDKKKASAVAALWFLCPLVIWSSAVACMFDSLSALFTVLGFYFMIKERYLVSGLTMAVAVSAKVFPICLLLVVLAYIFSKHKDSITQAVKNTGVLFVGAAISFFVIYLPILMSGNLTKSFEFLSSRSDAVVGEPFNIVKLFTEISYNDIIRLAPILIIVLLLIAIWLYRSEPADRDKNLLISIVLSFSVMFFWPPVPTYPVVLIPFLAMVIVMFNGKKLMWSWWFFSIFMVAEALLLFNFQLLYSLAAYTNILDLGSVMSVVASNSSLLSFTEQLFKYTGFIPAASVFVIMWQRYKARNDQEGVTEDA